MNIQFFWDKKHRKLNRSRFNLLLLDYGEYFLEDFSAYHFPLPTNDLKQSFEIHDHSKIQGRLKLNSRSIIFEPNDVRYPLLKFPYRYMISQLEQFNLTPNETNQLSIQVNGFFTFLCSQYHEMKAHNKIGPYKMIEYTKPKDDIPSSSSSSSNVYGYRLLFALVYADLQLFLTKIENFRHIYSMSEKLGSIIASQHLKPFLENALISSFDTSNLVDFHERFLLSSPISVRKIKPLVTNPGTLVITEQRIYFQPAQLNNIGDTTQHFELKKVIKIYKRRHMLRSIGLEFMLHDGSSFFFVFESTIERDRVFDVLHSPEVIMMNANSKLPISLPEMTRKWQRREISNFEYIMYLNHEAGRTSNDLTQYPVFPHIIADYKSRKLHLDNPSTFRDLSKPIGALNADRLKYFKERYYSMPPADPSFGLPPPFLYGTHYSTPGYVLYYLVRVAPEYMLCLQNGRFDAPDRMFHSIADTWESCLTNPTDLKELIPEFFIGSGEFLNNLDDLDLGHRYSGDRLHDVELPPWADSSRDFIRKHIKALESEYVSNHLHEWIDLIFGYKQQGDEAIQSDNLFYYLTYEGAVNLDTVKDVRERAALESQIQEFGQTPRQLFKIAHPSRKNSHAAVVVTDAVQQAYEDYFRAAMGNNNTNGNNIPMKSNSSSKEDIIRSNAERKSNDGGSVSSPPLPPPPSNTMYLNNETSTKSNNSSKRSSLNTPPPPASSTTQNDSSYEDVNDNIAIMHLGEDFRLEVERHISNEGTTPPAIPPAINKSISPLTVGGEATIGSSKGSVTTQRATDLSKIRLLPSEAYYWHSKAVTGVSMRIQMNTLDTIANRRKVSATVCSIGKDSLLKVVKVDQDFNPLDLERKAGLASPDPNVAASTVRTQCTISRSYSASGSSLSSVILSSEGSKVIFSSWDNHLYAYSISSASSIGKRYAHYDCVTSVSVDRSNKWLLSGSLDASVKLWSLKQGTSNIFSPGASVEFSEHDYPIHCVAINADGDYGAAGAEDGSLTIWDLGSQLTLCSYSCSGEGKRPVTAMKWLPIDVDYYKHPSFTVNKLIVGTEDGNLLCLDQNGKLYAGGSIDTAILSLDTDGRIIVAGCQDGSIRVWIMSNGQMQLIHKYTKAHSGGVTAISLGKAVEDVSLYVSGGAGKDNGSSASGLNNSLSDLMVSGSDDCSIRIWRIWYDQ